MICIDLNYNDLFGFLPRGVLRFFEILLVFSVVDLLQVMYDEGYNARINVLNRSA